jgi:Protein of unknown function (DUF2911)
MTAHRLALALFLVAASTPALAQPLDLPRPSPFAAVKQTVGLTEITVDYSSPGVKGRKIWGGLVPYDKMWRAGANSATKVTFSRDVKIDGKPVPAGSYSLWVIPSAKGAWTIILNKNPNQGGVGTDYKQDLDLLRVQVKPQPIPSRERLAYLIADFTDDAAQLQLEWEKVRLSLPIQLATAEQAAANIKSATDGAWRPWNSAARYMLETKKDFDAGLVLVERSIAIKEDWLNLWTKAQLLAGKKNFKEAYALAEKAKAMGDKLEKQADFFFAEEVKKALGEWKGK